MDEQSLSMMKQDRFDRDARATRESHSPDRPMRVPAHRWPRGFVPVARVRRIPEIQAWTVRAAVRRGAIPVIKVHGRWFVSCDALGGLFGGAAYVPDGDGVA
jgi:hypothetical protein